MGFGFQPVFRSQPSIVQRRLLSDAVGLACRHARQIQETCLAEVTLKLGMRFLWWMFFIHDGVEGVLPNGRTHPSRSFGHEAPFKSAVVEAVIERLCGTAE